MILKTIIARLPKGSVLLGIVAVVNVVLAFVREGTIAYYFGTSSELDVFLTAFAIPQLLAVNFTQLSVSVVLPLYVGFQQAERHADATALVQKWFVFSGALTGGICVLLFFGGDLLMSVMAPGFDAGQRAAAADWLRTLLPYLWLLGVAGIFKVVLNSHHRFFVPAMSSAVVSTTVIMFVFFGAATLGIGALSAGFVVGGVLGFTWQIVQSRGFEPRLPVLRWVHSPVQLPLAACGIMVIHYLAQQLGTVVDRGFASGLSEGSIAAYSFAMSIAAVPSAIVTATIGTALFPLISRMSARGDVAGALRMAGRWSMALAGLLGGPALIMVLFRTEITSLLLQRGAFDASSVKMTADVLGVSFFLVPVRVVMVLHVFLLLSQRRNWTVAIGSVVLIVLKILFNFAFVHQLALVGLASSSLVAILLSTGLLVFLAHGRADKGGRSRAAG